MILPLSCFRLGLAFLLCGGSLARGADVLGAFSGQCDVGDVRHEGGARFETSRDCYIVSGSGSNMWFANDAFHFVWKKISGDARVTADIRVLDTDGAPHRKACLLIRQSLAPDSLYADAALHGNGLTSLQYRESNGAPTREIQANVSAPPRLAIEKRGDYVFMSVAATAEPLHPAGGAFRVSLEDPYYVGLGVCAHDADAVATAEFSHVEVTPLRPVSGAPSHGGSTLEVVDIRSKDRRAIYYTTNLIEAPNWTHDGKEFIFNRDGLLWRLPVAGGRPEMIDTGFAHHCDNDHGLSPDGTQLAFSDQTQNGKWLIYLLPLAGGAPRPITTAAPSYWHGWSPDGQMLAFCGERHGSYDVYTIPITGGEEKRLTTSRAFNDSPDYSPDGRFIYFNSVASGRMQIWRMKPDGAAQEQVTSDDFHNWFPHPSPDGQWIVFLSYPKKVTRHPPDKDVMLRLMPAAGGNIDVLAKLFGGQGTINVPSWSPDSTQVAFVSYIPRY
ncbi:MAG: hypothetical protein ABSG59_19735 [Verrucomicrobiota bacterium]